MWSSPRQEPWGITENKQNRTCIDSNKCNTFLNKSETERVCQNPIVPPPGKPNLPWIYLIAAIALGIIIIIIIIFFILRKRNSAKF